MNRVRGGYVSIFVLNERAVISGMVFGCKFSGINEKIATFAKITPSAFS